MGPYKIIACDLDDTLADTKQPITPRMATILSQLLDRYHLCIISGGPLTQLQRNVITHLDVPPEKLAKIHLISTSGARYDCFDASAGKWTTVYRLTIPKRQRDIITNTIEETAKSHCLWLEPAHGKRIDDRISQVTFSALGQNAAPEIKRVWDPTYEKRKKMHTALTDALPDYEIVVNGTTSIDVLQQGIDKAFGIKRLIKIMNVTSKDILFFGDSLYEGGNDYPVKRLGISSIGVTRWQDTARYMKDNLL